MARRDERIALARANAARSIADLIDAHRAHPDGSYADAITDVADLIRSLPPLPSPIDPGAAGLTPDEQTALDEGRGDEVIA